MGADKSKAVIWGAGGFTGGELLRLVLGHPGFELVAALSNTHAGRRVGDIHPGLAPWTDLCFTAEQDWTWERLLERSFTLFSAGAHVETMRLLPPVLEILGDADVKVVDLSGDFRLDSPELYRRHYGHEHVAEELLGGFVYGLPELNRPQISKATRVANPGCFATCAQLAILPMAAADVPARFVAVDGKTGSSGAGVKPRKTTHHPYRMNSFAAYKQLAHQHFPEIRGGWLGAGGSEETPISFVPQRAPMVRGIFVTAHFFMEDDVQQEQVEEWYHSYYSDAPFVRIVEGSPEVSEIWGTNRCDISVAASGKMVVACAAIDNLVKGASGQALQNANLMNGFEETAGLLTPAPFPV